MPYRIEYTSSASKALSKLPTDLASRIKQAVSLLANNPRPQGSIKLTATDSYRIRVGDYRIVYTIHKQRLVVEIVRIGHRREIYER